MDFKQKIRKKSIFLTVAILLFGLLVLFCDVSNASIAGRSGLKINNYCACGIHQPPRPQPRIEPRILEGEEGQPGEFPWMVHLRLNGFSHCGATLITQRHVLSAAHCFREKHENYEFKLLFVDGTIRTVRSIKLHPYFDLTSTNNNNDIAIIEMEEPISLDSPVKTICLPYPETNFDNAIAVVSGYGTIEEGGPYSDSLQRVNVPVISTHDCQKNSAYAPGRITNNMICAGYWEGKRDSCQGDSGGPLQVRDNNGAFELIGIVSFGTGCGKGRYPGIYTKVQNYLQWIANHLSREDFVCKRFQEYYR